MKIVGMIMTRKKRKVKDSAAVHRCNDEDSHQGFDSWIPEQERFGVWHSGEEYAESCRDR